MTNFPRHKLNASHFLHHILCSCIYWARHWKLVSPAAYIWHTGFGDAEWCTNSGETSTCFIRHNNWPSNEIPDRIIKYNYHLSCRREFEEELLAHIQSTGLIVQLNICWSLRIQWWRICPRRMWLVSILAPAILIRRLWCSLTLISLN